MATENKAVTVYLPPDLEQYISGYCLEYDVTRKNKAGELQPSLGTGIVDLLKIECNVIEKLYSNVPSKLTESVLKEIQESSGNLLSKFKSSVLKELPDREKLEKAREWGRLSHSSTLSGHQGLEQACPISPL